MAGPPAKVRCVFDCMVFLQAAVSRRGPAFALLTLAETGRLELLTSFEVLSEVREVLLRPAVQRKFPLLTTEFVDAFLVRVGRFATPVEHVSPAIPLDRDPDDEIYVNLAVTGQAQYFVTRDRDLLDLATDPNLRRVCPKLKVIDPVSFLEELATGPE